MQIVMFARNCGQVFIHSGNQPSHYDFEEIRIDVTPETVDKKDTASIFHNDYYCGIEHRGYGSCGVKKVCTAAEEDSKGATNDMQDKTDDAEDVKLFFSSELFST